MKIITWNMAYWSKRKTNEEAWHYLVDVLQPDLALVQESNPPKDELISKKVIWNEIRHRGWGTGIYSKYPMNKLDIETNHPEAMVAAEINLENGKNVTAASIYGLFERKNDDETVFSTPLIHHLISDLTWLLLGRGRFSNKADNLVLGGDLNVSVQYDGTFMKTSGKYQNAHKLVFDRIADFGLHSVFEIGKTKEYIQTLRHPRSKIPWQNDYLFLSDALFKKTTNWTVIDDDNAKKLSDHNPVMAEIAI
ncbi:MAG: endonuclease/exonuclease/phosphatase family protein [Candidatus Micrarchaeia archaeon]|jgi:endonuclease/exonuclease/phosphatase family metal-dependent hydrolase